MAISFPQSFDLAARLGFVDGVSEVAIVARAAAIQTIQPPLTVGPGNALQLFATANESWEIVSSSAADAAAGTGARSVLISYLDSTYTQQQAVVALNGITPVAIAANCFRHQSSLVITAGSGRTNAGTLTLRVAGAGATRALVSPNESGSRQASFTVPVGHVLYLQNTNYVIGRPSGPGVSGTIASYVHLPSGVLLLGLAFTITEPGIPIDLTGGLSISERITFELRVLDVSANDTNVSVSITGLLINTAILKWPVT